LNELMDGVERSRLITNFTEIEDRENYVSEIDPKVEKPTSVVKEYRLAEEIQCGLSTCHRLHKKGFLVGTSAGNVVNIGHICGARVFGNLGRLISQFQQKERFEGFLDRINIALDNEFDIVEQISAVRNDFGLDQLQAVLSWVRNACPLSVMRSLRQKAARKDFVVTRAKKLTERELQERQAAAQTYIDGQGRERTASVADVEEEVRGELKGMDSLLLFPSKRISEIKALFRELRAFREQDIQSYTQAKKLSDQVADLADTVNELYWYVDEAQAFLEPRNLALILELPWDDSTRAKLRMVFSDPKIARATNTIVVSESTPKSF